MALDPSIFKRAADQVVKNKLVQTRTASSDLIEAKANIIAERIVNSNPAVEEYERLERIADEYDGYENHPSRFTVPPREESGLISDDIVLDESQIEAVKMLVQEQYGCLIGAAGTGKTTTTKAFLYKMIYGDESIGLEPHPIRMLDGKQSLSVAMVAFTGQATQVIKSMMPDWLKPACKTIHSLLEYAPVTTMVTQEDGQLKESWVFMPMRHAQNKLQHDIIIIDEASMVGVELWEQIVDACYEGTKIFMIGDLNQLPPVIGQSVFAYALSDYPVAELTHIHRQKEAAANRIVEVAHQILQGDSNIKFDDPSKDVNWRVIGYELPADPQKAGAQVVAIANALRTRRVHESVDPETPLIYDPYRDRVITAGNGYNDNDAASSVQQSIINEALSLLIEPPTDDNPRIIIDAGRSKKKFAIGHRVMATRNEPPDVPDRVTNGMVGVIIAIGRNPAWNGNRLLVGPEKEVAQNKKEGIADVFGENTDGIATVSMESFEEFSLDSTRMMEQKKDREGGGPASHSVTVEFANKAVRTFTSKNQVDSLMLAYASTCHKCQGSQFDTAIIVVHHSVKGQLSREWLYTAVTRAQKRVVLLYTPYGLRAAIAKQKIFGRTLAEKIKKYQELQEESLQGITKRARVRLYIEDNYSKQEEVA